MWRRHLAEHGAPGRWFEKEVQCQPDCKAVWPGVAGQGVAGLAMVWQGVEQQSLAWHGLAWRGRLGLGPQGKYRKGMLVWIGGYKKPRTARLSGLYEGELTGSFPGQAAA